METPQRADKRTIWRPRYFAGIVMVATLPVIAVLWRFSERSAIQSLVDAAPEHRHLEARLTGGFPWRPFAEAKRVGTEKRTTRELLAAGAASAVLEGRVHGERSPHARGVAYLVSSQYEQAVEALQVAAAANGEASTWSDLGAALLALSDMQRRPSLLPRALSATDRAIAIDASTREALFNRALILERLGLRSYSLKAWSTYADASVNDEGWAEEGRQHLRALRVESPEPIDVAFERLRRATLRGDAESVRAIVASHRQQCRRATEVVTLGAWGDATLAGNAIDAESNLSTATYVGDALRVLSGESLLSDAVGAITHARGDARATAQLAQGHVAYRDGRRAYGEKRLAEAERLLLDAAAAFAAAQSPMQRNARYFAANVAFDAGQATTAVAEWHSILGGTDCLRTRALCAEIGWQLGQYHRTRGEWAAALNDFARAAHDFEALGEIGSLGQMHDRLSDVLDHLGDSEAAWQHRIEGFRHMSNEGMEPRIQVALGTAMEAEEAVGHFDGVVSFAQLVVADHRQNAGTVVYAYLRLHEAYERLGRNDDAQRALAAAARMAEAVPDPSLRAQAEAFVATTNGAALAFRAPGRAIALLDRAIETFRADGRDAELPPVLLARGRALRALSRIAEATAAFDEGITIVERQRSGVQDVFRRAAVNDAARGLFEEAIELRLERHDERAAFELVERERARALLEELSGTYERASLDAVQRALTPGSVVIEHAVLQSQLVTFAITKTIFRCVVQKVSSEALRKSVAELQRGLRQREDDASIRSKTTALHDQLIAPVSDIVNGAQEIIFVPDAILQSVPFASLREPATGMYLVEMHELRIAPSAAFLARSTRRSGPLPKRVLIVDPQIEVGAAALPAAAEEALMIASRYRNAEILAARRATPEAFVAAARDAGLIHFGGHGLPEALLFNRDGEAVELFASEIAKLPLGRVRLVTLAACRTFRAGREHVEWSPTTAHAFLAAGVDGVVGTVADVDDDAAKLLFDEFHRELASGCSATKALRSAQLVMLRNPSAQWRHPGVWAALELIGNDTALLDNSESRERLRK